MKRKVVTILGLGHRDQAPGKYFYNPTTYVLHEAEGTRHATPTDLIACALEELFEPEELVVLGTEKALANHGPSVAKRSPRARIGVIPDGKDDGELWALFSRLKAELDVQADPGQEVEVILDITHGFRSQPFFAAAVISFLRATRTTGARFRVVYGAFEQGEGGHTPLRELTAFVELVDAAVALQIFLRTGQGDEVGNVLESLGRALDRAWFLGGRVGERPPPLRMLAGAIRSFGDDFTTVRTGDLLFAKAGGGQPSSEVLIGAVDATLDGVRLYAPPFEDPLLAVRKWVQALAPRGLDGTLVPGTQLARADVQSAMQRLAHEYLRLGRHLEAICVVREGAISAVDRETSLPPPAGVKSSVFQRDRRQLAEARWMRVDPEGAALAGTRNDLLHAGFQVQPATGETLRRNVAKEVERAARPILGEVPEVPRSRGTFANITNHDRTEWSELQLDAARAIAPDLQDIKFPSVPPDADDAALALLEKEVLAAVPRTTTHALVMGEMTLTFRLVEALEARGVTCLATTSSREATVAPDGTKTSRFEFVGFRPYRGRRGPADGGET